MGPLEKVAAIHAAIPEHGHQFTFRRAVVVDTWADLKVRLQTSAAGAVSWVVRVLILTATALALATLAWAARSSTYREDRRPV